MTPNRAHALAALRRRTPCPAHRPGLRVTVTERRHQNLAQGRPL